MSAAYQTVNCISSSLSVALLAFLAVSVSRLKDSPFRKTDFAVIFFNNAASRIYTYARIHHSRHRSVDWVFRHEHQRNMTSALGWGSRPKRFLHLGVDCSLHSHAFTLRVYYLLSLPLSRVSLSWILHFLGADCQSLYLR